MSARAREPVIYNVDVNSHGSKEYCSLSESLTRFNYAKYQSEDHPAVRAAATFNAFRLEIRQACERPSLSLSLSLSLSFLAGRSGEVRFVRPSISPRRGVNGSGIAIAPCLRIRGMLTNGKRAARLRLRPCCARHPAPAIPRNKPSRQSAHGRAAK
jgi:hypothetical protein